MHALFKSCDAVVIPSRNEPFGIVVLEAWSSGKPVVATKCGGPRDFVNPDHTGYLVVRVTISFILFGSNQQQFERESSMIRHEKDSVVI